MRDTPSFSVTLCSIISSLLCLTGVTSADKSQTNITIAFLGPYLAFPGVKLNGSLVTAYPTFASNIVRYNGVASSLGLAIWCDIGAQIAVDMINKSPNILPNATIIVKRFNDLDPVFSRGGSGYGMQVAMKIQEEHPDVVAVYGGNGITQTLLSSSLYSIFKIPHCTSMVSSERFDNENKRPYYFSLLANTGSGSAICLLLNRWNVKRVGFITESGSADLVTSFNRCNVRIVSLSKVENDISVSEIVRIGNLLEYYDIRYIIIDAGSRMTGLIYFTLASKNISIGPEHVWIGTTTPIPIENGNKLLGTEYTTSLIDGFITISGSNSIPKYYDSLKQMFVDAVNNRTKPLGRTYRSNSLSPLSGLMSFDCIGVLASGFTTIMRKTSPEFVAQRKAQDLLNYTTFMNSKYSGFSGDPVKLRPSGDILTSFIAFQFSSDYSGIAFGWMDLESLTMDYFPRRYPIFAGNLTIPPLDGPIFVDRYLEQDSTLGYAILFFEVSGLLTCALDLFVTVWFRHLTVVRSQIISFSCLIIFGAALGFSSSFFEIGVPSVSSCLGGMWFYSLSFTIISVSISVKNTKLGLIFNAKTKLRKFYVHDTVWLLFISGFIVIDTILLSLWSWSCGLYVSSSSNKFEMTCEYTCACHSPLYANLLAAYHVFLVISCAISAYKAKNVTGVHSNSSYTFILVISTILFTSVSIMINSSPSPKVSKIFAQSLLTYVILIETLLLKLVPKILGIWTDIGSSVTLKLLLMNRSSVKDSSANVTSASLQPQPINTAVKNGKPVKTVEIRKTKIMVKGVKVVYKEDGVFSEWISALCVLSVVENRCILIMLPNEDKAKGYQLKNVPGELILREGLSRLVVSCEGDKSQLVLDFANKEKAAAMMTGISKCMKQPE